MIEGSLNEALEPVVEVGLKDGKEVTAVPAIIDTGFSGYLCLSEQWIDKIVMEFHHIEGYELANGEIIRKDVFRGKILFGHQVEELDIILTSSDDNLIGASLLKEFILHIDYPQRLVQIEESKNE